MRTVSGSCRVHQEANDNCAWERVRAAAPARLPPSTALNATHSSGVAARAVEADRRSRPGPDRRRQEYDRDAWSVAALAAKTVIARGTGRSDHGDLAARRGQPRAPAIGHAGSSAKSVFDRSIAVFDKTGLAQAAAEPLRKVRAGRYDPGSKDKPIDWRWRLLRTRDERPQGCCPTQKRDEFAPSACSAAVSLTLYGLEP